MSDTTQQWKAAPHQWGGGKIHLLKPTKRETLCGVSIATNDGELVSGRQLSCKLCQRSRDADQRRAEWTREYQQREIARRTEQENRDREWHQWYDAYLRSAQWRQRSALVIQRANGLCEGCGYRRATQVHHITYAHVGEEFLFELRAVCDLCHQRLHQNG